VAEAVEYLPSQHKALSSKLSIIKQQQQQQKQHSL
jgi:hypothetical protein